MSPYLHPVERHEQPLRECPVLPPSDSWRYLLGWLLTGLLIGCGVLWLVWR